MQLQSGRVLYPIGYGADPSGKKESSEAIQRALEDASQLQNGMQMLPGINDLGGVVIDLQGGNFKISQPLKLPSSMGNVVVSSLSLSPLTLLLPLYPNKQYIYCM